MTKCNLIVDSCCDLPPCLLEREGVTLLKFPYIVDGESREDDMFQSSTARAFYDGMRAGKEPSTSQLPISLLSDTFTAAAQAGAPTVYLSFTSGLSGSFDVALMVRDQVLAEYPGFELYVVDTHLASIAEGLLVYEALRQFEKGMSASELAQWAEEARYFVNEGFMVEDLDCLRRGGRIPSSVAIAGAALDVKPLLAIDIDGKLTLTGVARGRKKGIKQMVEFFSKRAATSAAMQTVVIGHSDCEKDLERFKEALLKVNQNLVIIEANIGPVIGSHVGPGMLAMSFWGVDKREDLSVADKIARKVKGGN